MSAADGPPSGGARVLVLGTAQDGGVPHAGCACPRCAAARALPGRRRRVACVALEGRGGETLLVDATPDLPEQWHALAGRGARSARPVDAVLLTHAHVGHYLGLAFLGREVMHARALPVLCTAAMEAFLASNRPWAHLLDRGEIVPRRIVPGEGFAFAGARVTPFLSPHRAEDTDTVGLEVAGPTRRLVYVPDADVFPDDVVARIRRADVALVDGTFHDPGELPGRALAEVPHPFVVDSVRRLEGAAGRVLFTHLNHTNPLLDPSSPERAALPPAFGVAQDGDAFDL